MGTVADSDQCDSNCQFELLILLMCVLFGRKRQGTEVYRQQSVRLVVLDKTHASSIEYAGHRMQILLQMHVVDAQSMFGVVCLLLSEY